MREIKHDQITVFTDRGVALDLSYSILVDESRTPTRYGVRVDEGTTGQRAEFHDLTTRPQRAQDLVDRLVRNTVTPTTLADVVGDWL